MREVRHIPLMTPFVPEAAVEAVAEVLRTRWIGQGPKVEEFEGMFARYMGSPSVAVGSCTDALHLAYILAPRTYPCFTSGPISRLQTWPPAPSTCRWIRSTV